MLTRDELNDLTFDIWMYCQLVRDKFKEAYYDEMIDAAKAARGSIDELLNVWEKASKARNDEPKTD